MARVIGIDGGSTSLRAVLLAGGEARRFQAVGGTNLHEDSEEVVVERLHAVHAALGPADHVCVGSAGIDAPGDRERFTAVFTRAFPGAVIEVVSDVEIIAACCDAAVRVCLIAGTGSNLYAVGPAGAAWVGGLDLPLTDWGSAAWIGEAALRRALREAGGMAPVAIGPWLLPAVGLRWPEDWRALKTVRAAMHKAELAALARAVAARADLGCPVSIGLLERAGDELADAVEGALARVDPGGTEATLLTVGAVVNANPFVRARVVDRFVRLRPAGTVLTADAAMGAARRALSGGG